MLAPLDPSRDLRMSGQVIYTGRSSMEVAVKMETIGNDLPEETVLIGNSHHTYSLLIPSLTNTQIRSFLYGLPGC